MKYIFFILTLFFIRCSNVKMYSKERKGFYDKSFYYWVQLDEDNPYDEDLTLDRLRITCYETKNSLFRIDTILFTPIFEKTKDTLEFSKKSRGDDYFYKKKDDNSLKKVWKQNKYLKLDVKYKFIGDTMWHHNELILKKHHHVKSYILNPHG